MLLVKCNKPPGGLSRARKRLHPFFSERLDVCSSFLGHTDTTLILYPLLLCWPVA